MKHLKPIIDSRREEQEEIGNGYKKPVGFPTSLTTIPLLKSDDCYQLDFLSWITERAQREEQTIENLTRRVLVVKFAAIHTSSMASSIYTYISSLTLN